MIPNHRLDKFVERINMKRSIVLFLVIAVVAAFTGFSPREGATKAPDFSLKTSTGQSIVLSKLKGKIVVVNFWATWCGPCRAEIPGFMEVYEKYKSKGLEIVGVSLDQGGWEDVKPFAQKFNISYPVVLGNQRIAEQYGDIDAIPTTFIIDKDGNIVGRHIGYMKKEDFENAIKSHF
jgi:Peroxiredoxin